MKKYSITGSSIIVSIISRIKNIPARRRVSKYTSPKREITSTITQFENGIWKTNLVNANKKIIAGNPKTTSFQKLSVFQAVISF